MLFCNISNIPNVSPHARHKTNNKQNKELSSDSFVHFIDPADLKNRILKYYTITNASFTTKKKEQTTQPHCTLLDPQTTQLYYTLIACTNNATFLYVGSMHKQHNLIVH